MRSMRMMLWPDRGAHNWKTVTRRNLSVWLLTRFVVWLGSIKGAGRPNVRAIPRPGTLRSGPPG